MRRKIIIHVCIFSIGFGRGGYKRRDSGRPWGGGGRDGSNFFVKEGLEGNKWSKNGK
jgi:uncharacterized spore protein YtfJ